jgi:hypothetical protein
VAADAACAAGRGVDVESQFADAQRAVGAIEVEQRERRGDLVALGPLPQSIRTLLVEELRRCFAEPVDAFERAVAGGQADVLDRPAVVIEVQVAVGNLEAEVLVEPAQALLELRRHALADLDALAAIEVLLGEETAT